MDNTLIILLLCILLVLLLFLIITVVIYGEKLRGTKKIVRSGLKMILPNYFDDKLNNLTQGIKDLTIGVEKLINEEKKRVKVLEDLNKKSMDTIKGTYESFSIIAETKNTFEKELNFYKKGAEKNYVNRFLSKFVKFRNYMHAQESNPDINEHTREAIRNLLELFDDELLEFDVLPESPEVGTNYKHSDCVADKPEFKFTNDLTKDYQIISYQTPAFYYEIGDKKNYISKSKVTIYRYKGDQDGQNNRN